jgi:uncharacterized protein (DUF2141 family)
MPSIDPCSQNSFSVNRFWICSVLALLLAATNLFAQVSDAVPHLTPNEAASSFLQPGIGQLGQPALPVVRHVSPGMPQLQHPRNTRGAFVTPEVGQSSIFQSIPTYATGGLDASSTAIGDVNGDGIPDLVVVNRCASASSCEGSVGVLLGNSDGTFQTAVSYSTTGADSTSVALADINGDGHLDILVANECGSPSSCNSASISVLLGNGDGTFQAGVSYAAAGAYALSIAVADVNGDGKPDVVIAEDCANVNSCTSGAVAVFLGNGNGTFQTSIAYNSGGIDANSVAVADVNGDGYPDVVVTNYCVSENSCSGGTVDVLLGNGNGTFQAAVSYNSGGFYSRGLSIGDMNGDGKPDLVVASQCNSNTDCTSGTVAVLLGNGNGTFQSAVNFPSGGPNAFSTALADVNGDGKMDVIVGNLSDYGYDNGMVGVLLGNGDGTLQTALLYNSGGNQLYSLLVKDVNGDGKPDILATNLCADGSCNGSVSVLFGNGNGTFQGIVPYNPGGVDTGSLAAVDVNGDGKLDLLVVNGCSNQMTCTSGSVGVLLGNGNGTFQNAVDYASGGADSFSLAVADVNGDGKLDLLVSNQCSSTSCTNGSASVLLGNGDGTFQAATAYPSAGLYATAIAVADVNGDGKLDLVVANECNNDTCTNGAVGVLLGNGDGTFQPAVAYNPGGYRALSLAIADVNGDGKPDLLLTTLCSNSSCTSGSVAVLLGNGDGTFQSAVNYNTGGLYSGALAVKDVNGDGKLDLVVTDECQSGSECSYGFVDILLGNGDGTFQAPTTFNVPTSGLSQLVLTDLNGDGNLDIASSAGGFLLLGNGDGTFQPYQELGAGGQGLAIGDFNGDGKPDLAAGGITVLLNVDPAFMFTTSTTIAASANPAIGPVSFTAAINPSFNAGAVTGDVTFYDGSNSLGSIAVGNNGQAVLNNVSLSLGTHAITASYLGSSTYRASASTALSVQSVPKIASSIALAASSNSGSLTLTATVTLSASGTLTGTVSFMDGATVLGTSPVNGSGVASLTVAALTAGTHTITAVYSGNGSVSASTSSVVPVAADFALSATAPSPASLTPGQSATSTITVSPKNGFNPSGVTFTCNIAPVVTPAPTCSFGTLSVTNDTGSARLTIATSASASAHAVAPTGDGPRAPFVLALLIPGLLFASAGIVEQHRGRVLTWVLAFLVLGGCLLQAGCGGSSKATTPSGNTMPAGVYSVTITGSANGMQHSTTASVTVN